MFSRLREHFGTAGLVVAIVALVAALGGGAYAATGAQSGGKATASAKAKQGKQGKPGKTGPQGPAGPAGPAGPVGPVGPAGAKGDAGPKGDTGATGPAGATGATGAAGKDGKTGFTETLPSGKTETGVWGVAEPVGFRYSPISFALPLEAAPELIYVLYSTAEGSPLEGPELEAAIKFGSDRGCPGVADGRPLADPGKLCVYASFTSEMTFTSSLGVESDGVGGTFGGNESKVGVGPTGTVLGMTCTASCSGHGVWAVTAE
jgi:Collagen triple helix repeat (20 copies)